MAEYEYEYRISYSDHRELAHKSHFHYTARVPSDLRLETDQDAYNLGKWVAQEFERVNPDCRVTWVHPPDVEGSSSTLAESVDKFILFIVLVGVLCAICGVISLFSGDSPSYEGLGGDPNPSSQSADPCSLFERNCDEGTTSGDTVPDENGDIIDK